MKTDPTIREIPVLRSILIEDLGSDIYRLESEGKAEFAATKVTLAQRLSALLGLAGELAPQEPAKKRRTRGPNKPKPVLAPEKEAGE